MYPTQKYHWHCTALPFACVFLTSRLLLLVILASSVALYEIGRLRVYKFGENDQLVPLATFGMLFYPELVYNDSNKTADKWSEIGKLVNVGKYDVCRVQPAVRANTAAYIHQTKRCSFETYVDALSKSGFVFAVIVNDFPRPVPLNVNMSKLPPRSEYTAVCFVSESTGLHLNAYLAEYGEIIGIITRCGWSGKATILPLPSIPPPRAV